MEDMRSSCAGACATAACTSTLPSASSGCSHLRFGLGFGLDFGLGALLAERRHVRRSATHGARYVRRWHTYARTVRAAPGQAALRSGVYGTQMAGKYASPVRTVRSPGASVSA